MLLAIDVGNTNVSCAVFRGRQIEARWRMPTASIEGARALSKSLIAKLGRNRSRKVDRVCIASVVPRLDRPFREACRRAFGVRPLLATPETIGMPIAGYDRRRLGADRLVGALAAYERYRKAVIIVDIGTGITVDAVDARGRFLGGAIAPGPKLMSEALYAMTAKLPRVAPAPIDHAIGKSTQECIHSGIFIGCAGLVDRLVRAIAREMRARPIVVATGGGAPLIASAAETIDRLHPDLVLEGLRLIASR